MLIFFLILPLSENDESPIMTDLTCEKWSWLDSFAIDTAAIYNTMDFSTILEAGTSHDLDNNR